MNALIGDFWPHLVFIVDVTISAIASSHVVLNKRDVRAAIGWAGIIWLAPLVGTLLYVLFGVNRIARRAKHLRQRRKPTASHRGRAGVPHTAEAQLQQLYRPCVPLARLVQRTTNLPLIGGNHVEPLRNGCEAYPAMLAAIASARKTITLTTYIFDNDASGQQFCTALGAAVQRGVDVRVIVDDVGRRYSWNTIIRPLRARGVRVAQFLPTLWPWHYRYANLRSHRKIMVVDGEVGFTGGINIRHGNTLEMACKHPIQDMHFRVAGPVVAQLQEAFALDWLFCTEEELAGAAWFPEIEPAGEMLARGIPDGPDDHIEQLRLTLLAAIAMAERTIKIVSPYFIPDEAILTALNVAAMRGVAVDVVVPGKSNLRLTQWAMLPTLRLILDSGCRVWQSAGPFDHSKLMVVDGVWSLFGSANWDARSLRLNFEFNVEVYNAGLAQQLQRVIQDKITNAKQLHAEQIDERPLLIRLRDGIARLASPYL